MHNVDRKFVCSLCEQAFHTNELLIKHKIIHKDEDRVYLCKICKVAFTDHCDFLVHDLEHTQKKSIKCPECALYFNRHYLKLHIETHFDRKVKCEICGKTYQGENRLIYHMKTHDAANHAECGECGKIFKDKAYLSYHMMSHTGVKPIQCLYCGVGFRSRQQRDTHTKRKHTTDRPHECKLCGNKFKILGDLQGHMTTHDKEKKINCYICGKTFFHKESLTFHLRLHTKQDMFDCPECDHKSATRPALRTHILYKHTDTKDFKCGLCNLSFKTLQAITRHNKSKMHIRAEYGMKMKKK